MKKTWTMTKNKNNTFWLIKHYYLEQDKRKEFNELQQEFNDYFLIDYLNKNYRLEDAGTTYNLSIWFEYQFAESKTKLLSSSMELKSVKIVKYFDENGKLEINRQKEEIKPWN